MWLDNLKELKKEANMSNKQLAERSNLPIKTVERILLGYTANPYLDTLDRLATALNCTIGDIVADTRAVVGDSTLSELSETVNAVTAEKDVLQAKAEMVIAENAVLKEKISVLTSENEFLKLQLAHKEELLAVHNYYNKLLNK